MEQTTAPTESYAAGRLANNLLLLWCCWFLLSEERRGYYRGHYGGHHHHGYPHYHASAEAAPQPLVVARDTEVAQAELLPPLQLLGQRPHEHI